MAVALHEKDIKQVFNEITRALQPMISIVHVSSHPDETIKERLTQHADTGLGIAVTEIQVIPRDSVMKGIKKYCKENREDLLVLIHRKNVFLLNLFNQSVTGNFIRHTSIPLLILPG
jgi:nucleotide-binding universal stress UspA family protein